MAKKSVVSPPKSGTKPKTTKFDETFTPPRPKPPKGGK